MGLSFAPLIIAMLETLAGKTALRHGLLNHYIELLNLSEEMAGVASYRDSMNSNTCDHDFDPC